MATPQVAGLAACLRQAAALKRINILGSTLRAMLINGTVSCAGRTVIYVDFRDPRRPDALQVLGEPPDCAQGFGQASYRRSVLHIDQAQPRTDDGYGPIGFHQAGDGLADGIRNTNDIWPDSFVHDPNYDEIKASSYILPGRNTTQLRVTMAWNDLSGPTLQHQLRLEVHQTAYNPTTNAERVIAPPRVADAVRTYDAIDSELQPNETPVTLGTIHKVTWKHIDFGILNAGEVVRFQMKVHGGAIMFQDAEGIAIGSVGFSLAWISSEDDNF
jgi:hypothetical protein